MKMYLLTCIDEQHNLAEKYMPKLFPTEEEAKDTMDKDFCDAMRWVSQNGHTINECSIDTEFANIAYGKNEYSFSWDIVSVEAPAQKTDNGHKESPAISGYTNKKILAVLQENFTHHEAYAIYDMLFESEYDDDDVVDYIRWCANRFEEGKETDFELWVAETAIERTGAPSPKKTKKRV